MNDDHKEMTCEREGEEEGIFCVILQLAVSSIAPGMRIALLSDTSVTEESSKQ